MRLMVAEKAIAGKNISDILAEGIVSSKRDNGASYFLFQFNGEDCAMIPLSGHISEVDFPKEYNQWLKTRLDSLVSAPLQYFPSEPQIVSLLQQFAPKASSVTIATDADREGESIGVEAIRYLREKNPSLQFDRAYFSAISKKDIQLAFAKLSSVDYHFADSADARREIDLIWGAVLTRYISIASRRMGKNFLSVGRVQTPVLRLIVDREKERLAFQEQPYWELQATFEKSKQSFIGFHKTGKFWEKEEALKALEKKSSAGIVTRVETSKRTIHKPVPFNTTEFQRAAASIGFSVGESMYIAESLYQQGYTSYPRTDNSVYPASLDFRELLNELLKVREFVPLVEKVLSLPKLEASGGKQAEDHPPIYPVSAVAKSRLPEKHWKIYELIVRRFLATLSENAETENVSVEIDVKGEPYVCNGQVVLKMGWKELYPYSSINEVRLPSLEKGDEVNVLKIDLLEKKTTPPPRYSQSALIKLMSEKNLGTKSSRHTILQKLYDRQYIFGNKSVEPAKVSFAVIDALERNANAVTEPSLTAEIEKKMDEIAAGRKGKSDVVQESRQILLGLLEELEKNQQVISDSIRSALRDELVFGNCPNCGKKLMQRRGHTGKRFVGCTGYPECHTAFPLPQLGIVQPGEKPCAACAKPTIFVRAKRYRYTMCLDPQCPSKRDWGKPKPSNSNTESKPPAEKKRSKRGSGKGKK